LGQLGGLEPAVELVPRAQQIQRRQPRKFGVVYDESREVEMT